MSEKRWTIKIGVGETDEFQKPLIQTYLEGLEDSSEYSRLVAFLGLVDDVGRLIGHVAGVAVHVVARLATLKNILNNVIVGKVLLTLLKRGWWNTGTHFSFAIST